MAVLRTESLILDALPQGVLVVGRDSRLICGNRMAGDLLGIDCQQMVGSDFSEVLAQLRTATDGPALATVDSPARPFQVHGRPLAAELRALPDGSWLILLAELAETPGGALESAMTLNQELEAIFNSSLDEIFVTDGNGICTRVNAVSERLYGLKPEALVGRNVADLEREGVFSPSATAMVLRERKPIRMVQTTSTGRRVVVTANPVFDEAGQIMRVISNSRDVTDLMDLQGQLDMLEERAQRYSQELAELRQEVTRLPGLVLNSPVMARLEAVVRKVAGVDTTVLLLGESGVGKSAIARAVQRLSRRSEGPYIEVNCGAIPESLLESELFGYEAGAFTGARKGGKAGMVELASGGTLFLNEVGDLPLALQVKLLHVLQERVVTRVGGTRAKALDVRVIAATNRNLRQMVAAGTFREDLFYRLNVVPLEVPPLRERPEDIPALLRQQLERLEAQYGLRRRFSGAAVRAMLEYPWPGNVRELQNLVERLVVTSDQELISDRFVLETLGRTGSGAGGTGAATPGVPAGPTSPASPAGPGASGKPMPPVPSPVGAGAPASLPDAVAALERELISEALRRCGSTHRAAAALGVSQSTVARKARQYGLEAS
jgi:PAS domain S-box-containing protein